jgi:hypothetical protein
MICTSLYNSRMATPVTWLVRAVALVTLCVMLAALLMKRPRCTEEQFTGYRTTYPELVGRRVAVVRKLPALRDRDPATVYFVTDQQGLLLADPKLPYEGQPAREVVGIFQEKFGAASVVSSAINRKRKDKVVVVHDPRSQIVTRVHIPRRWSMPPPLLRLRPRPVVVVNPSSSRMYPGRTLVLTAAKTGVVTSARMT